MNRNTGGGSGGGVGGSGSGSGSGGSCSAGGSGSGQESRPRQRPPFVDESIVWPSQEKVANRLYDQTQVVLGSRNISNFRGVEFLLLTPRFVTLRQQTVNRLAKSELVPAGEEGSRVLMYTDSADNRRLFEAFKERVRTRSQTLFVMVADECHTSATINGPHNTYVNDEALRNSDNFVLLGVRCETYKGRGVVVYVRFSCSRSSHACLRYSATALPHLRGTDENLPTLRRCPPIFLLGSFTFHTYSHT